MKLIHIEELTVVIASIASPNYVIPIIKQEQDPDDSFSLNWEIANGISVQELGSLKNVGWQGKAEVAEGSAIWTAPDDTKFDLRGMTDQNEEKFSGALPPPLEIPKAIRWALNEIATYPCKKKYDGKLWIEL